MKKPRLTSAAAACLAASLLSASQDAQQPPPPVFGTGTAAVLLDVVVRDKKGRPVTDVRQDELEVYEEGVRQTIEGFKFVETAPAAVEGAPE